MERVGLLSFKNYSLVTGSNETYHYCTTLCSCLVGDIGSFGVVFGESTSNIGYHFLNKMFRIGSK